MISNQPTVTTYYSYEKTTETRTTQSRSQTPQRINDVGVPRRSIQEILSLPTQRSQVFSTHQSQAYPVPQSQVITTHSQVFTPRQSQLSSQPHEEVSKYSQLLRQNDHLLNSRDHPCIIFYTLFYLFFVLFQKRVTSREVSQSQLSQIHDRRAQRLTEHPMLIPFLMAAEIERLLNENDKLKFRIKECEDANLDRKSYEAQIRELQQRLDHQNQFQNQLDDLNNQVIFWKGRYESFDKNLGLKLQVEEKRNHELLEEIERLRLKLRNAEEEKYREFQLIREQYESERKVYVVIKLKINIIKKEKELNILTNQSINERQFLEGELRKTKELNQNKQREIDDLKNMLQQTDQTSKRLKELEQKHIILANDNDRLNKNLTAKLEENENWKSKYRKLDNQLNDLQNNHPKIEELNSALEASQQEIDKLRFSLNNKSRECDDLMIQNTRLSLKLKEDGDYIAELEEKNKLQAQEIDRLNHLIRQRNLEVDNLKQRTLTAEKTYNTLIEETEIKMKLKSIEFQNIDGLLRDKDKQLFDLDSRYKNLLNELDRLNGIIKQQNANIDNLKSQLTIAQSSLVQLEQEAAEFQQTMEQLHEQLADKSQQLEALHQQYNKLYLDHIQSEKNLQKLKDDYTQIINKKVEEIQDLRNMNDNLRSQLSEEEQRYNGLQDFSQRKIKEQDSCISQLREENSALKHEKDQLEANQTLLKYDLKDTAQALDNCRSRINQQDQQLRDYESEIKQLKQQIEDLKAQIKKLEEHIEYLQKYEENINYYTNQIRILSSEIDRLNDQLKQDEDELRGWRLQYAEEGSLTKKIQDQHCIMVILFAELESARKLVYEKEHQVEDVRKSLLDPYRK